MEAYRSGCNELHSKSESPFGTPSPRNPWFIRTFEAFTIQYFLSFSPRFLSFFRAFFRLHPKPFDRKERGKCFEIDTEWYRSGYNGPDSKSGVPATVPWVRIPPTPPISCWKCSIRSVLIEHFHYISRLFRVFSDHCMWGKFLSPATFNAENALCSKAFRAFGEKTGEKKLRLFRLKSKSWKHGICRGQLCAVV